MRKCLVYMLACLSVLVVSRTAQADTAEAADKAYAMAAKYAAMSYYITPSKEGHAGYATTLDFTVNVSEGLDYIFIIAGDRYCEDVNMWIESEEGNDIVKDTRKMDNGLAGVRWRSDYSGTVEVIVHFARVSSLCHWSALMGRRGTPTAAVPNDQVTTPTSPQSIPGAKGPGDTDAVGH